MDLEKRRNHVEKKDDEIVIIEYLLNNGHADTVEEAVYVFTQLDEDYIASILNVKTFKQFSEQAYSSKAQIDEGLVGSALKTISKVAKKTTSKVW